MRRKHNNKALLFFFALAGTAISAGFFHIHPVQAASSEADTTVTFEEFAGDSEDPQVFREYERLTGTTTTTDTTSRSSLSSANSPFKDSDYKHEDRFDGYTILNGIDVSVYQGTIDWNKAKAGGVDYAIIRVAYRGYGTGSIANDANYKTNIEGALAAGIDVGVYIYSQAITVAEAREEAQYAISLVKDYDISLPIVMDFEYAGTGTGRLYNANLTKAKATNICNAFCETAEAMGYTGMVYANRSMLQNQVNASSIADKYPIWLACYPANASSGSGYDGEYSFWQYTSTGSVPGISGNVDCNFRYIKKPAKTTMTNPDTSYTDNTLAWTKVSGVYGYRLYRRESASGTYKLVATLKGAGNISYFDYDLTPGTAYQYRVRAFYQLSDGNLYGTYSPVINAPTASPSVTKLRSTAQTKSSITLKWNANADADGYAIYRSTDGSSYKLVTTLSAKKLTYKQTGLTSGQKYYYQVRTGVMSSTGTIIYESPATAPTLLVATKCKAPTNVTAAKNTTTSIKLTWTKVPRATGYEIYAYNKTAHKYKLLTTIKGNSTTSYTVKKLKSATNYQYKIRAYKTVSGTKYYSAYSTKVYTSTKPVKVAKTSYTAGKNSITLSWNKSSGASGYIIYQYNKKTKKYTKIATVKTNKYTVTKLSKNTSYKFKIVAYKTYKNVNYKATGVVINCTTKK